MRISELHGPKVGDRTHPRSMRPASASDGSAIPRAPNAAPSRRASRPQAPVLMPALAPAALLLPFPMHTLPTTSLPPTHTRTYLPAASWQGLAPLLPLGLRAPAPRHLAFVITRRRQPVPAPFGASHAAQALACTTAAGCMESGQCRQRVDAQLRPGSGPDSAGAWIRSCRTDLEVPAAQLLAGLCCGRSGPCMHGGAGQHHHLHRCAWAFPDPATACCQR